MRQPLAAPMAVGGALVTGVAAMIVGGYRITDCLQYRTLKGECDEVVEQNVLAVVAGVAGIAGTVGGFFTYNRKLERPEGSEARPVTVAPPAPPAPPAPEPAWKQDERELVAFGLIDPLPAPPPPLPEPEPEPEPEPDPLSEDEALDSEIRALRDDDFTHAEIADLLEISRYRVRKGLRADTPEDSEK